jgi:drug/metabolite transporter (DMT)-like permease
MGVVQVVDVGPAVLLGGLVWASRHLAAPELSLLTLLEVIEGPLWSWLFAGEAIAGPTLSGGVIVLAALALNEAYAWRTAGKPAR